MRRGLTNKWHVMALALVMGLVVSACSTPASDTTTSGPTTTTIATTTTTESQAVSNLQDVRGAVVRITAEGTFEYPTGTSYNEVGSGSGFFITGDGLIVTNNHVVAGAGLIQVYVEGSSDPLNGRLVGTSECADLAVVDVDVQDAPFLAWSEEPIVVGEEILVAGFPLGDPEYTLIDGIISKESASGDTDWASIDSVIEHTGDTLPGSSGGPIVTREGRVVAVNYAGDSLGQAYGISVDTAKDVVERIIDGDNTLALGVNGWAYEDEFGTGVWVASVVPDSPADRVGLEAGDLITEFAGLLIAEDVTLAGYCDILDGHLPDRPFDIQVWRESDGSYYEGVVNSDQTLVVMEGFDEGEAASEWENLPEGAAYQEFTLIFDGQNLVSFEAPSLWADQDQFEWEFAGAVSSAVTVSPDVDAWVEGWSVPGASIAVSTELAALYPDPADYLAEFSWSDCEFGEQVPYDDGLYAGVFNIWVNCGGTDAAFVDLALLDTDGEYFINGQFTMLTDADIDAFGHILDSLYLTKDLEG
ncbi:MAG: serine protease [Actinobacteria bacterium]|nr:MAG: serine protease [Actinomycetota bacterium]